jgi:hypothetical protein
MSDVEETIEQVESDKVFRDGIITAANSLAGQVSMLVELAPAERLVVTLNADDFVALVGSVLLQGDRIDLGMLVHTWLKFEITDEGVRLVSAYRQEGNVFDMIRNTVVSTEPPVAE